MIETHTPDDAYPGVDPDRVSCRVDGCTITVVGEVDVETAPTIMRTLFYADLVGDVHFDLSGVTFADAALVHLLLNVQHTVRQGRQALCLRHPSEPVLELIRASGLATQFLILHTDPGQLEPRSDTTPLRAVSQPQPNSLNVRHDLPSRTRRRVTSPDLEGSGQVEAADAAAQQAAGEDESTRSVEAGQL